MKRIFLSVLLGLMLSSETVRAAPPPEWGFINIKDGFKKARDENKPIFVLFGFENCPWCKVLYRSAFSDTELREYYRKEFVLVYMSTRGENEEPLYKLPDGQELSAAQITKAWNVYPTPSWRWLRPDGSVIAMDNNARTTPREFRLKAENVLKAVAASK